MSWIVWYLLPKGIYVFNYHRIGNSSESKFDRDVFSCDSEVFDTQIGLVNQFFEVITSKQLPDILTQKQMDKRYAIITFDDGYKDNYDIALPILQKHGVSGIFFVPTTLIEKNTIPWWDEVAFILRSNVGKEVALPQSSEKITLSQDKIEHQIRKFISVVKTITDVEPEETIEYLREYFSLTNDVSYIDENLFMTWKQLKSLSDKGMEIGSHTVHHRILAKLQEKEQKYEIEHSKVILEKELNIEINAIAYPVGRKNSYNALSKTLVASTGYQFAFNNEPGINKLKFDRYDLNRFSVDRQDLIKVISNY
jgi:peptidoglycan/xylan/chitin deacetylase (PgdA/CDA1 family)